MSEMENKEISFEDALKKLETAVSKLENGEIKLDEAFSTFEEGLKLAKICEDRLKNIEDKVTKILKNGKEEDFVVEENDEK